MKVSLSVFLGLFCLSSAQAATTGKWFDHVVILVMENMTRENVERDPYFKSLMAKGASFENYKTITHPSYPNYLAMIGGETFGIGGTGVGAIGGNTQKTLSARHLGDLLESRFFSWKVYAEGFPGNCFLGETNKKSLYARKHVPFLSFLNVQNDKVRCARIVDEHGFGPDLVNGLPEYSMYIPNLNHDGHDSSLSVASKWLQEFLEPLLSSPTLARTLIVVTFDESESNSSLDNIYTVLIGADVKAGTREQGATSHYGLLRTVEENFSLGTLDKEDRVAEPFPLWQ